MIRDFIYDIPVKVYFGRDQMKYLGSEVKKYGSKVLLVYGGGSIKKMGLYDRVISELEKAELEVYELSGVEPNPRIESVRKGVSVCKDKDIEVILAVGGGSVMDCGKWIAAGATVDFDPWDFFTRDIEVEDALPVITMPTVAATGSEMDPWGVISNMETMDKIGGGAFPMLPKAAFENPENTYTCSPFQTACGSADILSHIMEVYFNMDTDFEMLDNFMEGLMRSVIKYTPIAMKNPTDYKARAELLYASTWAINGFIDGSKDLAWSCHPIEHELSARYDIPHGLGLAILTPRWMEYCLNENTVSRYVQFAKNVFALRFEDFIDGYDDMDISDMESTDFIIDDISDMESTDFIIDDISEMEGADFNIDDSFMIDRKKGNKSYNSYSSGNVDLDMTMARNAIELLKKFFYETSNLNSNLSDINIDEKYFDLMAEKAVGGKDGILEGFVHLKKSDVFNILKMCL